MTKLSWQDELRRFRKEPREVRKFHRAAEKLVEQHQWRALIDHYREHQHLVEQLPDFWEELASALDQIGQSIEQPEEKTRLLLEHGAICQDQLGRNTDALHAYHEAIRITNNVEAIHRAREIHRDDKNFEEVLRLYQLELEVVSDLEIQAVILREIGRTLLYDMSNPKAAEPRLKLAVDLNEDDEVAHILLERTMAVLQEERGRELQAAATPAEVKAPAAVPAEVEPELPAEAEVTAEEPAVEEMPVSLPAPVEPEPEMPPEEAAAEEPAAAEMGVSAPAPVEAEPERPIEKEAAAEVAVVAAAAAPPVAPTTTERMVVAPSIGDEETTQKIPAMRLDALKPGEVSIDNLLSLARDKASRYAGGEDASIPVYRKIVEFDPGRLEALWELAERLQVVGQPQELVDVLDQVTRVARSDADRERALQIMGRVRAEQLGDADWAMEAYEKLLNINPANDDALLFAKAYYTQRENWSTLAEILEEALAVRRRHELPFDAATELAELYWQKIGDLRQAERFFKRLRLSDPRNPRMLAFYADYFRREGDYRRLLPTLQSMRSQEADPEVQLELAFEMADVAENKLGQPDRAVDVWKSIYREYPDRPEPVQALRRLYTESQKHNALLEFLKGEGARCRDQEVDRKVGLLFEIADLYRDQLKMETLEVNTLAEVLALDPTNERATETLASYWSRTGNWNDLISLFLSRAEYEDRPEAEATWRRRVVDIWRDRLGNVSQAIPELERIVELCPDDREALEELKDIYAERDEPEQLLTILQRQAEQLQGEPQLAVMREMVQVAWKRLANEEETIRAAEHILQVTGGRDLQTLSLLEELYRERKSWTDVARILEMRRSTAASQGEEIDLLLRLGEVQTEQIRDLERGLETYHQILTINPEAETAVSRAIAIYVRLGRWDQLQDLCASRGEWERFFEIARSVADKTKDPALKIDLLGRMATVAARELADPQRAMECYEAILALRPGDVQTAEALVPYYEGAAEHPKLVEVLTTVITAKEGREAMAIARRIAEVYETDLRDAQAALYWAGRAVEYLPEDARSREDLIRLGREAKRVADVVYLLKEQSQKLPPETQYSLLIQAAGLCWKELRESHTDLAADLYRQVLALSPHDKTALMALEEIYSEAERYEELLEVLKLRLEAEPEPQQQVDLRLRVASVQVEKIRDLAGAIDNYTRVLDLDPTNATALDRLKHAHARREDWARVVEVAQREMEVVPQLRPVVLYELGQIYQRKFLALDKAIEAYAQLVRETGRSDLGERAVRNLEELADSQKSFETSISAILAPHYRTTQQWLKLSNALDVLIDADRDPEARARGLWELSEVQEQKLGDLPAAYRTVQRVANENPHDRRAWGELERLALLCQDWSPVVDFYQGVVREQKDHLEAIRGLARVLEQRLAQYEEATAAWEQIIRIEPGDPEARDALERLYTVLGNTDKLVSALLYRAETAQTEEETKQHLYQICTVLQDVGRPLEALEYYQRIFDLDETDERAFEALRTLLDASEDWSRLERLLQLRLTVCPPEEATTLRMQLGALRASELADWPGAMDCYSEVLVNHPENDQAAQALEDVARELVLRGEQADLRVRIYRALETVYEMRGAWNALAGVEELQLQDPDREEERITHHLALAALLRDRLDRKEDALVHLSAAWQLDFTNLQVRDQLEMLASDLSAWEDLVHLYRQGLESCPGDQDLAQSFHRRLAQLSDVEIGDSGAAVFHYRQVLEGNPQDAEALDALERLYEKEGELSQLVAIREVKANQVVGAQRLDLLWKNAELLRDQLAAPQEAALVLQRIHGESEADLEVVQALEDLYRHLESWSDLVSILLEKANLVEEVEEKRSLYHQAAVLYEDKLGDREAAVDVYRTIIGLDERDLTALVALEHLFEDLERWPDLADVLRQQIPLTQIPSVQNDLALRLARLFELYLDDRPQAITLYREVLEREPQNHQAIDALENTLSDLDHQLAAIGVLLPVYESGQRWNDVIRLLEMKLVSIRDKNERLDILSHIRRVHEEELQDADAALKAAARHYTLSLSKTARQDMERLTAQSGDYQTLARTYVEAIPSLPTDEEILSALLRLAEVYRDRLADDRHAEESFRQALDLDPSNLSALEALEQLYQSQQNHGQVLRILERRVEMAEQAEKVPEALAFLHRIAAIYEQDLDDAEHAITTFQRCLDLSATDPLAHEGLDRLFRRTERWLDLVDLLYRQVDLTDSTERIAELKYQLGWIYSVQLLELETSVDLFSQVLEIDPRHLPTVQALETLIASREQIGIGLSTRVAGLLEGHYRQQQAHEKLIGVLEIQADGASPEGAADRLEMAAQVCEEELGKADEAFAFQMRVFDLVPQRESVWLQLRRLAGILQAFDPLVERLLAELDRSDRLSEPERRSLALFLGDVLERDSSDYIRAREVYERVLETDPVNEHALDALERLYDRLDAWEAMLALFQKKATLAVDDSARIDYWLKAGRVSEEILADSALAVQAYQTVLDIRPGNEEAYASLERLFELESRYEDLVTLFRNRAAQVDSEEEQVKLLYQMGQTLQGDIGAIERAVPVFRSILDIQPRHRGAVRSLEHLLNSLRGQEAFTSIRQEIALILEDFYRPEEDWEKLVDLCEARLEVDEDPNERAALLQKAAQLTENYGRDLNRAFEYYSRAFRLNPDDADCAVHLDRLVSHTGNYAAVVDAYQEGLPRAQTRKLAIDLRLSTSDILETKLINPEAAIAILEELLKIDSHHPVALSRLEKLYRKTGNFEKMVDILARRVDRASDIIERKDLLYEMAKIQEFQLKDIESAAETLRRILDLDPEDVVALETLEVLLRKTRNYDDLASILIAKADVTEQEEKRRSILVELAGVYEHDLDDLYGAIDVYRNLHLDRPDDRETILALDRLYERAEKWGDLLDIIEVQRRLAETDEQMNSLDFRCATLMQTTLKDTPRAIQMYKAILERTSSYTPALRAAEELLDSEYTLQVADVLEPLYLRWEQWEKVIALMEQRLAKTEERGRRYLLLREMARLYEVKLDQPRSAFLQLSRALAEQPEDGEVLGEMDRLTTRFELWESMAKVLDEVTEKTESPSVRRNLLMKSAEIYRTKLDDSSSAISRYVEVIEVYPHDREALEFLDVLYQAEQDWDALAGLLPRRIEIATDARDAVELKFRLATILHAIFVDADEAIPYYEEILGVQPDHAGALEGMWQLARDGRQNARVTSFLAEVIGQKEDWQGLVELYELSLGYQTEALERARINRQIAEIHELHLGDPRTAFLYYAQSTRDLPDDMQLHAKLQELAEASESWRELVNILDEVRPRISDVRLKVDVVRRLASLYDQQLAIQGLAQERFCELLELNPGDPQALEALERIYTRQQRYPELWEILEQRAAHTRRLDERSEILAKMAQLAERTMGDQQRAAQSYSALLDLMPGDLKVIDELVRLYGQLQALEPLLEVLARKADLLSDPSARANIYCEIGVLAHDKLGDLGRAAEAFRMAMNLDPKREELYQTLEGLYRALSDWDALKLLLQARLRLVPESERPEIFRRLANLLEQQFGDDKGAISLYRQALKLVPNWRLAHEELTRLLEKAEKWEEVQRAYVDLEELLMEAPQANQADLVHLYTRMSEIKVVKLGDARGAAGDLVRLLELDGRNRSALTRLRTLQEGFLEWDKAVETARREAALVEDPVERSHLLYHQGQLLEKAGAPVETIRHTWEQARGLDPNGVEVIRSLKELYRRQEDYPAVWSALLQLISLERESTRQLSLVRELIEVARSQLQDPGHLVEALEIAQTVMPDDLDMAQDLATAYVDLGAYNRAAPLIDHIMDRLGGGMKERQLAQLEHLSGLVAQGLGDEERAKQAFLRAYKADMNYLPNLLSLGKIQFERGELDDALKTFQTMLLHQMSLKSPADRVGIFYHLGEIMLRKGDKRRARDMFSRALSIDRNHEGAKRGLTETQ